ncbi:MAG: UbiX family flavin prenyltransferase [Desulfurococcaceae archaeon]
MNRKLVVGLTGASGLIYGFKLVEQCDLLKKYYSEIHVIYTNGANRVSLIENNESIENILGRLKCIDSLSDEDNWSSPLASSSNLLSTDGVLIPASLNTIAKLANGIQDNLVLRVFSSLIRLKNKIVIVVRETPLSTIDLYNLYKLSRQGAIILPASPGFYVKPSNVNELIYFIVGKVLDVLGVEHSLYSRWKSS